MQRVDPIAKAGGSAGPAADEIGSVLTTRLLPDTTLSMPSRVRAGRRSGPSWGHTQKRLHLSALEASTRSCGGLRNVRS